jgi:hypothetical protein
MIQCAKWETYIRAADCIWKYRKTIQAGPVSWPCSLWKNAFSKVAFSNQSDEVFVSKRIPPGRQGFHAQWLEKLSQRWWTQSILVNAKKTAFSEPNRTIQENLAMEPTSNTSRTSLLFQFDDPHINPVLESLK